VVFLRAENRVDDIRTILSGVNLEERGRVSPLVNLQEESVSDQTDVLQGTLDLLIMRTIALEPMHGWAIAQRIQQISDEQLRVQQGSLYPALHRLEHQGWITAEWGASDNNRRARFYSLTRAGRKQLATEVSKWERLSAGVNLVLQRT
jgi:transcriptional regulator